MMDAKNKFRRLGQGSIKGKQFTNLLQNMSKEAEAKETARKKEIAEQARINQENHRLDSIF